MGLNYASSNSWIAVTGDGTIVTASKSEERIMTRWEAQVPGVVVRKTPELFDEWPFVWGAVVPGQGLIGVNEDPDVVADIASDRGGWVSLIRAYPGRRTLPQAPLNPDGTYERGYAGGP